jgi:hypothetical protein
MSLNNQTILGLRNLKIELKRWNRGQKMLIEKYKKINEYEIDNFEARFEIKYDTTIPSQA